jgi:hypothetical protein
LDSIFNNWSNLIGESGSDAFNRATQHVTDNYGSQINSFGQHLSSFNRHLTNFNDRYGHHLGSAGRHLQSLNNQLSKASSKDACSQM